MEKKNYPNGKYDVVGYMASGLSISSLAVVTTLLYMDKDYSYAIFAGISLGAQTLWLTYSLLIRRLPIIIASIISMILLILILIKFLKNGEKSS